MLSNIESSLMWHGIQGLPEMLRTIANMKPEDTLAGFDIGESVYLVGEGSSFHLALMVEQMIENILPARAKAVLASEFCDRVPSDIRASTVLAFSSSGKTPTTIKAFEIARVNRANAIAVTRAAESPLFSIADCGILVPGDVEHYPAVQGFIEAAAVLYSMICSIGARTQPELAYLAHSVTPNLEGLALAIDNALSVDSISGLTSIAELLSRMSVVVVAGSGFDHVVALEGALKLKEAASVHSEGTHVQNLVHGGIVSLNPETGIIILASSGRSSHPAQNLARACKQTGALVILLGDWGSIDEAQECDRTVVPSTTLEQPLSSLATMATLDMIACLVASFRDLNPDDFRESLPGFKRAYALLDT